MQVRKAPESGYLVLVEMQDQQFNLAWEVDPKFPHLLSLYTHGYSFPEEDISLRVLSPFQQKDFRTKRCLSDQQFL